MCINSLLIVQEHYIVCMDHNFFILSLVRDIRVIPIFGEYEITAINICV